MKKIGLMLALAILPQLTYAQKPDFQQKVNELLIAYHEKGEFSGSLLISHGDNLLYNGSYGMADQPKQVPIDEESVFCLASVSKIFTSAAIFSLERENMLSLSDPILKYFPELPDIYSLVTIDHLLTHTSGIPVGSSDWRKKIDQDNDMVLQFLINANNLENEPGAKYTYANNGFILLAIVVERISGMSFGGYLQEHIFKPLGMKNTYVREKGKRASPHLVKSYVKGRQADWPLYTYGAGGIYTTTVDLMSWDQAFFSNRLFDHETVRRILEPVSIGRKTENYGRGWGVIKRKGSWHYGHSGGMFGFRTLYEHQPDENLTIIILANTGETPTMEIRNKVVKLLRKYEL